MMQTRFTNLNNQIKLQTSITNKVEIENKNQIEQIILQENLNYENKKNELITNQNNLNSMIIKLEKQINIAKQCEQIEKKMFFIPTKYYCTLIYQK